MKRTRSQTKMGGLNQKAKKIKAIMMENFEKIEEEMVTSFGKFGRCCALGCPQRSVPPCFAKNS